MKAWRQFDLFTRQPTLPRLTPCERNLLEALTSGLTHKELSDELGVSRSVIQFHCRNIREKFGVRSTLGAVARFMASLRPE